jgi:2-hydroxy-5-methyl-1-naphthoate 7-hydroxylase
MGSRSQLYRVLDELIAAKRAAGDDLTSALIAARSEDSRLSEAELVDTLILIGAGYETTGNLLDHAVTVLLAHRDQLERVFRMRRCGMT